MAGFLRLRQDDIRPVFHLQTYASRLSIPCTAIQIEGDSKNSFRRCRRFLLCKAVCKGRVVRNHRPTGIGIPAASFIIYSGKHTRRNLSRVLPLLHFLGLYCGRAVPPTAVFYHIGHGKLGAGNGEGSESLPGLVGHCLSHPGPQDIVPGHSGQPGTVAGLLIRVSSQAVAVGHRAIAVVAAQQRLVFLLPFCPAANRKPEVQRSLRNKHRLGLGSKRLLRKNSGVAHLGASSLRGLSRNPFGGIHRFLKGLAAGRIPAANLTGNGGIIRGPVILRLIPVMDRFHRNIK